MKHIFAQKFVLTNIISACSCWSGLSCSAGWRSSRWTHSHWISDKAEMPHDKGLFWGRCAGKQAGFHCTCLILCQLLCLADGLMTKECWHAKLGLLSCLEARSFWSLLPSGGPQRGCSLNLYSIRVMSMGLPHQWSIPATPHLHLTGQTASAALSMSSCHSRALALDASAMLFKTRANPFFWIREILSEWTDYIPSHCSWSEWKKNGLMVLRGKSAVKRTWNKGKIDAHAIYTGKHPYQMF